MLAFHNNLSIKERILNQLKAHYAADEIIKGKYWENGKGCAVGCTIHSHDHSKYESELGIPLILASLEDKLFEKLPDQYAKDWPIEFIKAIPVGKDLSFVWPRYVIWVLTDDEYGIYQYAKCQNVKDYIKKIAHMYESVNSYYIKEWDNAVSFPNFNGDPFDAQLIDITSCTTDTIYAPRVATLFAALVADLVAASARSDIYTSNQMYDVIYENNIYMQSQKLLELLRGNI